MPIDLVLLAIQHSIVGTIRGALPAPTAPDRDRGAVSLEQVLWFVAAGVAVAVIAAILWGKIRNEADKPITPPVAP